MKSLARVPVGVWVGVLILLGSAWVKDGWGFCLGIIVIAAVIVTTSNKTEDDVPLVEEDDGWGTGQDRSGPDQP